MSDELRGLFDAFETHSLGQTIPPGPDAVRRTVQRRYATRAVVLAVAAVAALLVVFLPPHAATPVPIGPPPSLPPNPTSGIPGPTATSNAPVGTPSRIGSSAPADPACDPNNQNFIGLDLGNAGPDQYELTPAMLAICPRMQLRLTRASYVGSGTEPARLTRTGTSTVTLTASQRSATLSVTLPKPSCAAVLIMTYSGSLAAPSSLPNLVPALVSAGTSDPIQQELEFTGGTLLAASWQSPAC